MSRAPRVPMGLFWDRRAGSQTRQGIGKALLAHPRSANFR